MEPPAHALLERLNLLQRRPRNHCKPHISRRQVHHAAVDMIRNERAARAALHPPGTEHEVIHNQLASAAEKIGQRLLAFRPIKHVSLLTLLPRQFSSLPAHVDATPTALLPPFP